MASFPAFNPAGMSPAPRFPMGMPSSATMPTYGSPAPGSFPGNNDSYLPANRPALPANDNGFLPGRPSFPTDNFFPGNRPTFPANDNGYSPIPNYALPTYPPQAQNPAIPTSQPANQNEALSNNDDYARIPQTTLDRAIIGQLLNQLGQIRHLPMDEAYMRHLGVNPPVRSGAEALQIIRDSGVQIEFGDMGDSPAHALYIHDEHLIMLNQRYRHDISPENLLALTEALYHESGGHLKDGDSEGSIQEELDCMSLNTMAHRYHEAMYPEYAQATSTSRLLSDGVAVYPKLFFDVDPYKQGLVNRIIKKYGDMDLPMWSPGHPAPPPSHPLPMVYRIARQIDANNVAKGVMPPSPSLNQDPSYPYPIPTVYPIPTPQTSLPAFRTSTFPPSSNTFSPQAMQPSFNPAGPQMPANVFYPQARPGQQVSYSA